MPDNTVVSSLSAAVADLSATNNILVRFVVAGSRPTEVSVPEGATLRDALAAANLPLTDKVSYVQGGAALRPESQVRDSVATGASVIVSQAGANG